MRGLMRSLGFMSAATFVLITIPIFFIFNLAQVVTDRQVVKEAINGEVLLRDLVVTLIGEGLQEESLLQGLPLVGEELDLFQESVVEMLPPEWASTQADAVLDAIFDYLETGDESALVVTIDVSPLLDSLAQDEGADVVESFLDFLPTCTTEQPEIDLEAGIFSIPGCLPAGLDVEGIAGDVQGILVDTLEANGELLGLGGQFEFNLLGGDEAAVAQSRAAFEQLRRLYQWGQRGSWFLWVFPLVLLLLLVVFGVRSPDGFGHWLGWPLLATGLLTLLLTLLFPLFSDTFLSFVGPFPWAGAEFGPLLERFVRSILDTLFQSWIGQVRWQAAIMLIAGLFLAAAGLVVRWMLAGEEGGG